VRVITDPRGAVIRQGEILVAERTDPGWIMLFPACSGLLVERGSLLSHSAIVAREMGIPAVVSIPGITTWLKNGDLVEMDGASGLVRRLNQEEQPDAQ
jgi:pyruvate,water dikinase